MIAAALAAVFAAAAYGGAFLAEVLCARRTPFVDGPRPVAVGRWPFALAGAAIGLGIAVHGEPATRLPLLLVVTIALAGCTAADLACGALPDLLTLAPLLLVIGVAAAMQDWMPAASAVTVMLPFAALAIFSRGRGMGWGDVKLAALGGALLGLHDATVAFMLASLAAYGGARLSGGLGAPIAFGPYLAASIAATLAIERTI